MLGCGLPGITECNPSLASIFVVRFAQLEAGIDSFRVPGQDLIPVHGLTGLDVSHCSAPVNGMECIFRSFIGETWRMISAALRLVTGRDGRQAC